MVNKKADLVFIYWSTYIQIREENFLSNKYIKRFFYEFFHNCMKSEKILIENILNESKTPN